MTGEQKQHIQDMRLQGLAFSQIADSLGLSVNTVKSYCRRALSKNDASEDSGNEDNKEICKHCGKRLIQKGKQKPKTFCCDKCRFDWWNANRDKLNRKTVHQLTCAHCGAVFDSYDKSRKYCGHACYIVDRFSGSSVSGEEASCDERTI